MMLHKIQTLQVIIIIFWIGGFSVSFGLNNIIIHIKILNSFFLEKKCQGKTAQFAHCMSSFISGSSSSSAATGFATIIVK